MAVAIVETRAITGGMDTHADVHVAAALDPVGGLLGVREFPVTAAGYAGLLGWLGGFGTVCLVGIEGTGSYGAGLARHMSAAGVRVVEVDRSDRGSARPGGLACVPGSPGLFRELAGVSFGQVVSASSIVGKMVNNGPGPVARKAGNRERT